MGMGNGMPEKSLRVAIQLNLVFPGLGYCYIGKTIVGIIAVLLVIGIYLAKGFQFLVQAYLVMNAVMAIDMIIWNGRTRKQLAARQAAAAANSGFKDEEADTGKGQQSS